MQDKVNKRMSFLLCKLFLSSCANNQLSVMNHAINKVLRSNESVYAAYFFTVNLFAFVYV